MTAASVPGPAAGFAAGGLAAKRQGVDRHDKGEPDAHEVAHETIHEQTRQAGTGRDRETAKLLLRHTTADLRLRDEKTLKRLRA
jgi:hypothetical protein